MARRQTAHSGSMRFTADARAAANRSMSSAIDERHVLPTMAARSKRMRLTPRRILLHVILVLATLALPLLLPSSCGPVVHSDAVLTAAGERTEARRGD